MIDKNKIIARAGGRCEYCKYPAKYSPSPFVMEHVIPLAAGGETSEETLAYSCQGCNGHKYVKINAIDPVSGELVMLYHPRQQPWEEHFTWSDDKLSIIGLTPAGRATVKALHLNRSEVVNLRKITIRTGEHPPE